MYEIYLINSNKTIRHLSKFSLAELAQFNLNQPIEEKNNNSLLKYKTEANMLADAQLWRLKCLINFSCVLILILKLRMGTHLCEFYFLLVKHEKSYVIHEEFDENQRPMSRNKHALPPAIHARHAKASEKMYLVWVSYVIIDQVSNFD